MKKLIYIMALCLTALLLPAQAAAAKKPRAALSPEQQQQFLYYFYASREAIRCEQYDKAYILLDFCEQLNPYDGLTKENLAILHDAIGDGEKALQLFEEAYRLAPDDCWGHYAETLMQSESAADHKKARKIVEQVFKRKPKDADVADFLQQIYMHKGLWKQALAMQDKIDALVGYNGSSALTRYRIYFQMNKPKLAVEAIDKYIEQDPTSLYFLLFRADIYIRAELYEDAYHVCERIAKLLPLDEQELDMLKNNYYCLHYVSMVKASEADSLILEGEIDRAFEAYEMSIALTPLKYALNNYAYNLAIHGGDLSKAERMSAQTIKDEPSNSIYLDTYGWILHLQGQDALALFYLRKALETVQFENNQKEIEEHLRAITGE